MWFSALLTALACGGETPVVPPDVTPAAVVVAPSAQASLASGQTLTLTAVVQNKGGQPLTAAAAWSSSDPTVATVSAGLVTAVKTGSATITAAAGSVVSSAVQVTVTPGPVAALALRAQPANALIRQRFGVQPVVELRDAAGNLVTSSTATITAAIAAGGGVLSGTATVAATAGVAAFTDLVVTGLPGDRTLAFTASGGPAAISATSASFRVSGARIILDSSAVTFTMLAGTAGQTTVVGIHAGNALPLSLVSASAPVYDAGEPSGWLTATATATSLTLATSAASLAAGTYHAHVKLTAADLDAELPPLAVTLIVQAPISKVSFGGATGHLQLLNVGQSVNPVVVALGANSQPLDIGATLTFSSRRSDVAVVDAAGRITARGEGATWVIAASAGPSDSIYVNVTRATGPIFRTTLTDYVSRVGDTTTFSAVLDTRGALVGAVAGTISMTTVPLAPFSLASGTPTGVTSAFNGIGTFRVNLVSSLGVSGAVDLLRIRIIAAAPFAGTASRAGLVFLTITELAAPDGTNLLSQAVSTQLPLVFP